jgi:hypothetical protein
MHSYPKVPTLSALALAISLVTSQALANDDVFGSAEPSDDLFGGAALVSGTVSTDLNLAEDMLTGADALNWSGDFQWETATILVEQADKSHDRQVTSQLSGNLKLDARPDVDYRVLVNLDYSADQDGTSGSLREAFADFDLDNKIFVRAGQQTLQWGVGYFFSPADTLSQDKIAANDPDQDRVGTLAAKIHKPVDTANYYGYLIPDDQANNYTVALKGEWLLNGQEWGLGAIKHANDEVNLVVTGSIPTKIGDFFTEYSASLGETSVGINADNTTFDRTDALLHQLTVGVRASQDIGASSSLSLTGQYYYNGLGYTDDTWSTLPQTTDFPDEKSQQMAAVMIRVEEPFSRPLTVSVLALSNLTDGFTTVDSSLTLNPNDYMSMALTVTSKFGDNARQSATDYKVSLTLGSQSF